MFKPYIWLFYLAAISSSISQELHVLNVTNTKVSTLPRDGDSCELLLESFALASANYTFCVIRFANPTNFCQFCVGKYQNVLNIYNDILNTEDTDNKKCKDKLLNSVLISGFNYVDGLWKRANCNYCFVMDDQGNPTKELNENTKDILQLSNDTQTCIAHHKNDNYTGLTDPSVCLECKQFYVDLNSRYDSLKHEGFCMDIVDLMSATREQWSVELGCCLDRKQPEWLFLVSSVVFTCLPFAFYLGAFMFVTRKEQTVLKQRRLQENFSVAASTTSMMVPD